MPSQTPLNGLCHEGRNSQTHLLLGGGEFSLIFCFFFDYSFTVWLNLGLSLVSAKPCSQLALASRILRLPAILLGSHHSTGALILFVDSENIGKIKPALGHVCDAVRHKIGVTEGCQM